MIEFVGRDGNRLAADVAGDPADPPVVLLHGGGQTRHSWGTTLGALGDKGWRAYAVDLRGHGESEWAADGDYTLDAFAGDVLAISRVLDAPPALVGASLGGISSLAAIGEHPDEHVARALVLVDVAPRMEEQGRMRIGAFMAEHMDDGFASLDEVADAIQQLQPAPAAPVGSRRPRQEPAARRRRPLVLALGSRVHRRPARRRRRDPLVARRSRHA